MHGLLCNNNKREPQIPHIQHHPFWASPSMPGSWALKPTHQEFNLSLAGGLGQDFHYSETENINYLQVCHYRPIPRCTPSSCLSTPSPSSRENEKQWSEEWIVAFTQKEKGPAVCACSEESQEGGGKAGLEMLQAIL